MKNYTVFHIEKSKGSGAGLGNHIDRADGKEHSYKNADSSRTHLNKTAQLNDHSKKPLQQGIKDRIKDGYTGDRAIREDAVKYLKVILSGSHERMKEIEAEGKINKWAADSINWLSEKFGKENIVKAVLHMDEKTPHIHCVVVPLIQEDFSYINKKDNKTVVVKKGALSAKEILRSPKVLKDLHTDYTKKVGVKYNLLRGEERKPGETKTPVTTLNKFYDTINRAEEKKDVSFQIPQIEKPTLFDLPNLNSWTEKQNQSIKNQISSEVGKVQEQILEQNFRTASEIMKLEKYKENTEKTKQAYQSINSLERDITDREGSIILLNKKLQETTQKEQKKTELLKAIASGKYNPEVIKAMLRDVGIFPNNNERTM